MLCIDGSLVSRVREIRMHGCASRNVDTFSRVDLPRQESGAS